MSHGETRAVGVAVRSRDPEDGVELLLSLARELPGVELRCPPDLERAIARAALGHKPDRESPGDVLLPPTWLPGCDLVLFPRLDESWRDVYHAALTLGIPVVAGADGAGSEIAGMGAETVPAAAGVSRLADVARRILADEPERSRLVRLGGAQLRRVERTRGALLSLDLEWLSTSSDGLLGQARNPAVASTAGADHYQKLSVVLALHGRRELTQACLESLRADRPVGGPPWEIVCVDNASPDDTREWLQRQPDVLVVALASNRGCPGGWNAGLRSATGEVLCVLNNDTVILPGGMRRLAAAAWRHGIACYSGGMLAGDFNAAGYTDVEAFSDYPDGCALAFRRDVWADVGEFDEGMGFGYCEDADWGLRARSLGYGWSICPGILTHAGQSTASTLAGVSTRHLLNTERLRRRWSGRGVGQRLLVRRWGALGDVIMATPVLSALRAAYPLARIHFQCAPTIERFLRALPGVDRIGAAEEGPFTRRIDLDGAYEEAEDRGELPPFWPPLPTSDRL